MNLPSWKLRAPFPRLSAPRPTLPAFVSPSPPVSIPTRAPPPSTPRPPALPVSFVTASPALSSPHTPSPQAPSPLSDEAPPSPLVSPLDARALPSPPPSRPHTPVASAVPLLAALPLTLLLPRPPRAYPSSRRRPGRPTPFRTFFPLKRQRRRAGASASPRLAESVLHAALTAHVRSNHVTTARRDLVDEEEQDNVQVHLDDDDFIEMGSDVERITDFSPSTQSQSTAFSEPSEVIRTLRVLSKRLALRRPSAQPVALQNDSVSFFEDDFVAFACGQAERGLEKRPVPKWLARLWNRLA